MMRLGRAFAGFAATMGAASVACAHAGHGNSANGQGFAHYLIEPIHVGVGVTLVVAAFLIVRALRARSGRRAL